MSRPTPYSIAVSALICLMAEDDTPFTVNDDESLFDKLETFTNSILLQKRDWSSLYDIPIIDLLKQIENHVNIDISNQFHSWLQIAATSLDAFYDMMNTIHRTYNDGSIIDPDSMNGIYIRSCSIGFEDLSFENIIQLWNDYCNQVIIEENNNNDNSNNTNIKPPEWTLSTEQMDSAIREQCYQNDSIVTTSSTQDDIPGKLDRILEYNPELTSAYFLKFLYCLQSGERIGAIDALHQYIDYALIKGEDILQFASILKAALHAEFGETDLAAAATEEAVRVAQQSQDTACVAFALGWLSTFNNNSPEQTKELLQRCVQRANEVGQLNSLQIGANHILSSKTNTWLPLLLTEKHSLYHSLVAAGLWNHFGVTVLSSLTSKSALLQQQQQNHQEQQQLTTYQVAVAIHNICRCTLIQGYDENNNNNHDSTTVKSVYGKAIQDCMMLREVYKLPTEGVFLFDVAILLHEWTVRRNELDKAEILMGCIESHVHPRIDNYEEIISDIISQKALLRSRQGRYNDAKSILNNRIEKCKLMGNRDAVGRLLLQLAMIHLEEVKDYQFTCCLPSLMECLKLSKDQHMYCLHASALSVLAHVHFRMGNHNRAIAIIQSILPILLQQELIWLQGETYLLLSKCYMKRAGKKICNSEMKREGYYKDSIIQLLRCKELFIQCHDYIRLKEVYYLQARIYNELSGKEKERDDAAKQFIMMLNNNNCGNNNKSKISIAEYMSMLSNYDKLLQYIINNDNFLSATTSLSQ